MLAVIRIRGPAGVRKENEYTMESLRLNRVNHLVLLSEENSLKAMLKKIESYVTWGEINQETLERLLQKRALSSGNIKVNETFLKEKKINSFKNLVEKLMKEEVKLIDLNIKPVFRLSPPKKGYERQGIKKSYSVGGALGYRASDVNALINRMM